MVRFPFRRGDLQSILGTLVAIAGFLMVGFANPYKILHVGISAQVVFIVNGAMGLSFILIGIAVVVVKR